MRPMFLVSIVLASTAACIAEGAADPERSAQEVACPSSIPAWSPVAAYSPGAIVAYGGAIYRCLQRHTAIASWTPEAAASLWERVVCSSTTPPSTETPGCGGGSSDGGAPTPDAGGSPSDGGGPSSDAGPIDPPPPSGKTELAPYFYAWGWGNPAYPFTGLVDLKSRSGLSAVTIAFVLADGGCKATRDVQDHAADVKAFVASGGRLKASFGGAQGTYLESACGDADSLAKAISDFVAETGITDLDFDVEQAPSMTPEVNARRAAALAKVQKERGVRVAFTLSCTPRDKWDTPGGLSSLGLGVLQSAVAAGVAVSHVNLMTMDYGSYFSSGKTMGELAISAATDAVAQLRKTIPGLSEEGAWAKLGITPMIGQNDVSTEVFTLADAKSVAAFARARGVGLLSFWAINRDQPGSGSLGIYSHAQSKPFAFADAFRGAP